MPRAEGVLPDLQCALVERLGHGVTALISVEASEIVETQGHVGMLRSEDLFCYRQGPLIERDGLGVAALVSVQYSQIVQARGYAQMFRT